MKPSSRKTAKRITKTAPSTPVPRQQIAAQPVAKDPPQPQPLMQHVSPASPPSSVIPATVEVGFSLFQPQARRVSLCSEFNGWSPEATPMKRSADGHWRASLTLRPGRYQYKFVVDGEWLCDPEAAENVPNQYGTLNSVAVVQA